MDLLDSAAIEAVRIHLIEKVRPKVGLLATKPAAGCKG